MENTPTDRSSESNPDREVGARAVGSEPVRSHDREHSADPIQVEEGFEQGQRSGAPDTEVGRFDTGVAETGAGKEHEGRFDEGVADTDAPDKEREGRFDDGVEA